ncbi:hypothetical protein pdul_cds_547 [Pandoravirus dulcis]|uniref:Uncharacterized protein n=1 Tax=Pandoravirus dulcis TaxID=1349409 RepID=S4VQM4_9VIRU|nr:hypothetical protein pdul_cds_547 [Pandoravirus dulcis]AGO82658.1 hypothetical protein pdul_cds_547 [Pandoravirus dulcis]
MTTVAVFKRPLDIAPRSRPAAKKPRTDTPPRPLTAATDDDDDDDVWLWPPTRLSRHSLVVRDRIVAAALKAPGAAGGYGLFAALAGATGLQIASALVSLFGHVEAFERACRAAVAVRDDVRGTCLAFVTHDAACGGHAREATSLVGMLCCADEISWALDMCIEDDDLRAVSTIIDACHNEPGVSLFALGHIVRCTLREAVKRGRHRIVAYLADVADPDDVKRHLWAAAADHDDRQATLFAALWAPLGVCAHTCAAVLPPCPARDYLTRLAAVGARCPGECVLGADRQRAAAPPPGAALSSLCPANPAGATVKL